MKKDAGRSTGKTGETGRDLESRKKRGAVHGGDLRGKDIFGNHELCAQFLRDYSDIPQLRNVQAEDIEEYSQRYHFFNDTELNSDTVKKIRLKDQEMPVYIIGLVEHKSSVDYNVAMQLLRYMVCIWYDWEKKLGSPSECRKKDFQYPPVIPIVYYEGTENWTAGKRLRDRILFGDAFGSYVPDFTYRVVRNRDYSREELLAKEDEISLLMLLNKIQQPEDFDQLDNIPSGKLNRILEHSSETVVNIIVRFIESLCRNLDVTEEDTARYTAQIKERNMGYFFENMEPMSIQEERRKTEAQRKKTEEERRKTEEQRRKTEEERRKTEEQRKKAEEERANGIRYLIEACQKFHSSREDAFDYLKEKYQLDDMEAEEQMKRCWKE